VLDGTIASVKAAAGARNVAVAIGGGTTTGVDSVLRDAQLVTKVDTNNNFFECELAPSADAQVLLQRLMQTGARIDRFELMQPSLHQIFLQRVGASGVETGMSGHG
jgi:ABC-2 type transport system ATP-binding protein